MPDLYGRLVGKRILGGFFLDEITGDGMHVCDYLLACDMEMNPTPGYAFTNWASGYGDLHAVPDLGTLRRPPRGSSAAPWCSAMRRTPRAAHRSRLRRATS